VSVMENLAAVFGDPNMQWVLLSCMLLGVASGVLGCFALLRKHSLLGDAVAHAALPGICLAFLVTGSKSLFWFMIFAAAVGWLASICIGAVTRYSKIKEDTALGLVLSVFFGVGIVMLTGIQHSAGGNQSGLDSFLFGKAASLVGSDVAVMTGAAGVLLVICFLLFKEFKLLSFDPGFGRGLGMPMGWLNALLMLLIVTAVVIGLQAVGVVLMAAMLITPALAARYWTERLDHMILLAGLFGAVSGALGTFLSSLAANMPTGPVIVLSATLLFLLSMTFAPQRGLLMKVWRLRRLRRQVAREQALLSLYEEMEKGSRESFREEELLERRKQGARRLKRALRDLARSGAAERRGEGWALTAAGLEQAYRLLIDRRMQDLFAMYEGTFGALIFDRDQGRLEDQLPPETVRTLWNLLKVHGLMPKLVPATLKGRGGEAS